MVNDQNLFASLPPVEQFTSEEEAVLRQYVTNTDRPVFALVNLPEVVKGALFARYSRSNKSLRRLLLDEFMEDLPQMTLPHQESHHRAEALYDRVFQEYGDDSVAQLGSVHLACEGVSNVLTKVLERGRLMSYLEQSTRYVPYNDQVEGRWKYHIPLELQGTLREGYSRVLDMAFETYTRWLEPMEAYYRKCHPRTDGTPLGAYNRTIRAKALDVLRGLLPAATRSNLGIYGSGQAYEALLLRMRASEVSETRAFAELVLQELRKVIPSFVARVDRPDRGIVWSKYLALTDKETSLEVANLFSNEISADLPDVMLTDFDPEGEVKVVAAILYSASSLPDSQLLLRARQMSVDERAAILRSYVGDRKNRRHRPGRAFERTHYRFDVMTDYATFRDLQRHRMLTIEWQTLSPTHGYLLPGAIKEVGAFDDWCRVMDASAELYQDLISNNHQESAPYAVLMGYRIRFIMDMNAREAMHVIELRTTPQGHTAYRRVCQDMHSLIEKQAKHYGIAAAMHFTNHEHVDLERLEAEKDKEKRSDQGQEKHAK
jgi:thymidylate synthase ThyX